MSEPSSLRVLYVTDRWDGPYRYRCQQGAEQLRAEGVVANVAHVGDGGLGESIERYTVLVLFRLPWSDALARLVQAARRVDIPLVFEIDDLTFDPSFETLMPFRARYSASEWSATYGRQMAGLRRTFDACDAFVGSTPELVEQARRLGKTAYCHPNVVPDAYLRAGLWGARVRKALGSQPTIGYFSGSDTHDEDFASIAGALARVFRELPEARLLVVGHLSFGGGQPELEARVVHLPYMHYRDFAYAYAACQVTLAPLATINAFTNSKSALKFFEAGAFSTPTIATPVREMVAAITHRETGFIARSENDWVDSLMEALAPGASARVGAAARARVEQVYSTSSVRGGLSEILRRHSIPARGGAPSSGPLEPFDENGSRRAIDRAMRPGRAARDLLRIVRAARRMPAVATVDASVAERWLDAVEPRGSASREAQRPDAGVALFLNGAAVRAFRKSADVDQTGELPGEYRSKGRDPSLTSPALSIDTATARYLVMRLRATSSAPARGQIFWKSGEDAAFDERSSVTFSVPTDGIDRTFVLDLHGDSVSREWMRQAAVTHLRVDPLDRPGSFRLGALALFSQAPRTAEGVDRDERKTITLSGTPSEVREELGARLRGQDVVVERLNPGAGGEFVALIAERAEAPRPAVDIVVPVYNARDLVLRCLASVLVHARGDQRLVIVDDASTDLELVRVLDALAKDHPAIVLLRNEVNLGFVRSANRGIRRAAGRDVLLLNSDTEVFEGFLERLRDTAYSDEHAGMVSPLSNNATICSVPEFCRDNPLPDGITKSEMASLVAGASERRRPELVTPHGFCLYLRADFIAEVGVFDEERFGRGFGEENDLGERAKAAGFRTLLADDVYVWHAGKGSFGEEGHALERRNQGVLAAKHPGYRAAVARFVESNPLSDVQLGVRRHLRRRSHQVQPSPLFILHSSPFADARGGVEHCVRDLVRALGLPRAVLAYPSDFAIEVAEVIDGDLDAPLFYRFALGSMPGRFCHEHPETIRAFETLLDVFRIGWVHVHHLMFLPLSLGKLLAERRVPYVVTVHDFYPACPSFNLLDLRTTTACCSSSCASSCTSAGTVRDPARTLACQRALFEKLGEPPPPDPLAFVGDHRRAFEALLSGAVEVLFPSESAARLVAGLLDLRGATARVLPHGYDAEALRAPLRREGGAKNEPLRVAIVGQVAYVSKGAEAYLRTIELALDADIEWHVFGRTDLFEFDRMLEALGPRARIVQHGAYERESIVRRLREARVDVGLLLPAWPETFSYTLSEMLAARVPVVARRVGALADRLEGGLQGLLVEDAEQAARELSRLAGDRGSILRMAEGIPQQAGTLAWAAAHRELYRKCAPATTAGDSRPASATEYRQLNGLAALRPTAVDEVAFVTRPSSSVTSAWWFQHAERLKPYVPESLRHVVRRRLSRDGARTVLRFRLPGPQATLGRDLTVTQRYVATTQLTSHGVDPFLVLGHRPLDPESVKLVRFNLWCSTPSAVFAQLYWRHEGTPDFDEEHSVVIPLDGRAGAWQEYVVRLDGTHRGRLWYDGGPVVALRFDPINVPGPIGLGELALCGLKA